MKLNESEQQKIYDCLNKFNTDDNYKEEVLKLYNSEDLDRISIYEIYVLEELRRLGNKNIIQDLFSINPSAVNVLQQVDDFINLYNSNEEFKYYKNEQFKNNQDSLSEMELYLLKKFLIKIKEENKEETEPKKEQQEEPKSFVYTDDDYEEMNQLDYSNDYAIQRTVRNLLFGKVIHLLLQQPRMKDIAERQKQNGQIHNMDRDTVIEYVLEGFTPQVEDKFNTEVDNTWRLFKIKKMFVFNDPMIEDYEKYNTNISSAEILAKRNQKYRNK